MSDSEEFSGDEGAVEKFQFKLDGEVDHPPEVQRRVKALKNIQLDNIKHEVEYYKELHKLDLKYQKIYDENNSKRKQIYLGEYEPTDLECEWVEKDELDKKLDKLAIDDKKPKTTVTGIPDFWLTALQNANESVLHGTLEEIDFPILKSLQDITVELPEENTGFKLHFHFAPNDYFTNSVLTKQYELRNDYDKEDPLDYDGPVVIKSFPTKIEWKSGKNPGIKIVKKKTKPKGKGKGGPKFVTKEEKRDTFFNFFKQTLLELPEKKPKKEGEESDEEDDEDHELFEQLSEDFDLGLQIKEKLIPKVVLYFTGEADDIESDDDFDDEELDDSDDLDDD